MQNIAEPRCDLIGDKITEKLSRNSQQIISETVKVKYKIMELTEKYQEKKMYRKKTANY